MFMIVSDYFNKNSESRFANSNILTDIINYQRYLINNPPDLAQNIQKHPEMSFLTHRIKIQRLSFALIPEIRSAFPHFLVSHCQRCEVLLLAGIFIAHIARDSLECVAVVEFIHLCRISEPLRFFSALITTLLSERSKNKKKASSSSRVRWGTCQNWQKKEEQIKSNSVRKAARKRRRRKTSDFHFLLSRCFLLTFHCFIQLSAFNPLNGQLHLSIHFSFKIFENFWELSERMEEKKLKNFCNVDKN